MISDELITRSINLMRLEAGEAARVIALLNRLQAELSAILAVRDLTDFSKARINQLLKESRETIRNYYSQINEQMAETMKGLGAIESEHVAKLLKDALVGPVAAAGIAFDLEIKLPTEEYLKALAGNTLIDGSPAKEWWGKQAGDVAFRFSAEVRQGLIGGETNAEILTRIIGNRDTVGVMNIARHNAAALVQTSVQAVANEARLATFNKNSDIVAGVRWLATLDSLTCARCGAKDGQKWTLEGKSITADAGLFERPPLHFNCRCTLVTIPKSFKAMGIDLPQPSQAGRTRASEDGQVPYKTTFTDYLKRKGTAFQDEVLGPGRAQMWRDGKITLQQLTDQSGRPLTLDQLRAL